MLQLRSGICIIAIGGVLFCIELHDKFDYITDLIWRIIEYKELMF